MCILAIAWTGSLSEAADTSVGGSGRLARLSPQRSASLGPLSPTSEARAAEPPRDSLAQLLAGGAVLSDTASSGNVSVPVESFSGGQPAVTSALGGRPGGPGPVPRRRSPALQDSPVAVFEAVQVS